jgi:hypothetical protein
MVKRYTVQVAIESYGYVDVPASSPRKARDIVDARNVFIDEIYGREITDFYSTDVEKMETN